MTEGGGRMLRRDLLSGAGVVAFSSALPNVFGCATVHSSLLGESLDPVDATRPRIHYRPIQGVARGRGGILAALVDLQRLVGVDGYVRVSVDQSGSGDHMVTVVTAYPFTYGTAPRPISIRVGSPTFAEPAVSTMTSLNTTLQECDASCVNASLTSSIATRIADRRRRARCSLSP
jgi:hypothetical protein